MPKGGRKERLAQGTYDPHGNGKDGCPSCNDHGFKVYLGEGSRSERNVSRVRRCGEARTLVQFSIGLQHDSKPHNGFTDVARWCSEHFNFHVHLWHHLSKRERSRQTYGLIHTEDELKDASRYASQQASRNYLEWVRAWQEKQK